MSNASEAIHPTPVDPATVSTPEVEAEVRTAVELLAVNRIAWHVAQARPYVAPMAAVRAIRRHAEAARVK